MIQRRPAVESDYQFMWELHRQTFRSYVEATWGWDEEWQAKYFRETRDLSRYDILVDKGRDIGCLEIRHEDKLLILEYVAILPEHQNQGLGSEVMRGVLRSASERGVPVRLSVLKVNPARKLYERMGFQTIGSDEFRYYMEAVPHAG
jgi:ribosomal protein S18 acetylase RimI-like enzyme